MVARETTTDWTEALREKFDRKIMPVKTTKRPKYYTPNEVSIHNTLKDLWVSFLGKVYDLTPLCEKHAGRIHFQILSVRFHRGFHFFKMRLCSCILDFKLP